MQRCHPRFVELVHIPEHLGQCSTYSRGKNVIADAESRRVNLDAEWKSNGKLCSRTWNLWQSACPRFLATRFNTQKASYVSYRPNPDAVAIGFFNFLVAFQILSFPSFQCHTPRCLTKYNRRSQGLLGFQMEDAIFIPSGFTTSPGPFSTTVSQQRLPQLPNYPKRIPPPPT